MRYIRLSEPAPALHQQLFAQVLSTPLNDGSTVLEAVRAAGSATPSQLYQNGLGLLADRQPLYQFYLYDAPYHSNGLGSPRLYERPGATLDWIKERLGYIARPLLIIQENVNWRNDRRRYAPEIESTLESLGLQNEYDRVILAGNWTRRKLIMRNFGFNGPPWMRVGYDPYSAQSLKIATGGVRELRA